MASDLKGQVVKYLQDAFGMEEQSIQILTKAVKIAGDPDLSQLYRGHLNDSRDHQRYVKQRLEDLGESESKVKQHVQRATALGLGIGAQAMPDTPGKVAAVAFAFEHLEIASYEMLRNVAAEAGDNLTVEMTERILPVERQAAQLIERNFELAARRSLSAVGVDISPDAGTEGVGTREAESRGWS